MIIDSAVETFTEKYNREMMDSIDNLKNEFGRIKNMEMVPVFNIEESFQIFNLWLDGYSNYCVENTAKGETPSVDVMTEGFTDMLNWENMFKKEGRSYDKLTPFVKGYVEGVLSTISHIDEVKNKMLHENVDQSLIGVIDDYSDAFMTRLNESFTPTMDRLLVTSGYAGTHRKKETVKKPVFL